MASSANPKLFVLQAVVFVVLFCIIGSLTFTVWNQSKEIQNVRQEMYNEIKKMNIKTDDNSIFAVANSLNRNRRAASQSSIDILANAITDIIEKKLYSILTCEQNTTECTLKPGPKGEKGNTGDQGKDGLQGIRGDPGTKGTIGNRGTTGRPGPTGSLGPKGNTGEKGEKGQLGYPGYKGNPGPKGSSGIRGPRGYTGTGLKGDIGPIGLKGAIGVAGRQGIPGAKGDKGSKGNQGVIGSRGPTGLTGQQGVKGDVGYPGRKGEKGQTGLRGPPGPSSGLNENSVGTIGNPAASCNTLYNNNFVSNNYWVTNAANQPVNVYCDMGIRSCCNSGVRGWMKVADINMTDSNQQCPNNFKLHSRITAPRRTCGRPSGGCSSTTFPVNGVQYSRVCGRIVAYQIGSPSAFQTLSTSIPVNGIVLTHGQSQQHIWSFFNGAGETYGSGQRCPCSGGTRSVPSSIGTDYFCDSAVRGSSATNGHLYSQDPLWDGAGCGSTSTCCQFNNPPWFCKQLPQPTTDDIELRLCENSSPTADDSPFEIVEIYVR